MVRACLLRGHWPSSSGWAGVPCREAIRSLELQGLVVTRHGSGSFVDTQSLDAVATLMAPGKRLRRPCGHLRDASPAGTANRSAGRPPSHGGDIERLATILEEQKRQILEGETGVNATPSFISHWPPLPTTRHWSRWSTRWRTSCDAPATSTCNGPAGRKGRCIPITKSWKWCAWETMQAPAAPWTIT